MRGKKVFALFDELGGKATTEEMRVLAKHKYPNLQLYRTLHTALSDLLKDNRVVYDAKTKTWHKVYPDPGPLVLPDLPPEMEPKKVILKVTEEEVREKMNQFEINPDAKIFKIDGNKEPIWPSEEDPTKVQYNFKGKFKYRDRHEIARSVIESINQGKTRTTGIMYNSWLSHYQLKKYLTILRENDLIRCDENNDYSVTQKGLEFLDAMKKVSEIKFD